MRKHAAEDRRPDIYNDGVSLRRLSEDAFSLSTANPAATADNPKIRRL